MNTSSDTNNITPLPQQANIGDVKTTTATQTPVQVQTKPIDITAANKPVTIEETQVAKQERFDKDINSAPTSYIQKYMSGINNKQSYIVDERTGDERSFGNILGNTNSIKIAFGNQFKRDGQIQTEFKNAQKSFAQLDNTNYRYMHNSILGNMRVAIDPETGKDIGLPELCEA